MAGERARQGRSWLVGTAVVGVVVALAIGSVALASRGSGRSAARAKPTRSLSLSPTTNAPKHVAAVGIPTVSCETQNLSSPTPPGLTHGPVLPKTVRLRSGVHAEGLKLSLFVEGSKFSDQLSVLAPSGWVCLGSEGFDGAGDFDVYPVAAAPAFTWSTSALPRPNSYTGPLVSLRTDWLGHGTTAPLMCPWLSDPTFSQLAQRINSEDVSLGVGNTISCAPPVGAQVTHLTLDISKITFPNGTLGAATATGTPPPGTGTVTLLECRGLPTSTCKTVVDEYIARVGAHGPVTQPPTTASTVSPTGPSETVPSTTVEMSTPTTTSRTQPPVTLPPTTAPSCPTGHVSAHVTINWTTENPYDGWQGKVFGTVSNGTSAVIEVSYVSVDLYTDTVLITPAVHELLPHRSLGFQDTIFEPSNASGGHPNVGPATPTWDWKDSRFFDCPTG